MRMKPFTSIAVVIFAVISLMQILRALLGWVVTVNGLVVPLWASVIASAVAAALAIMLWRENRR
jgi:hypothetical protein